MNDLWSLVTKTADRWRYLSLAAVLAATVAVAGFGGCDQTAKSPTTGEALTRAELEAEREKTINEKVAKARALASTYEAAVRKANDEHAATLARLADAFEIDAAEAEDAAAAVAPAYDAALAAIDAKEDRLAEVAESVKAVATTVNPAAGSIIGTILGILGIGGLADARRKTKVINAKKGELAQVQVELARARTSSNAIAGARPVFPGVSTAAPAPAGATPRSGSRVGGAPTAGAVPSAPSAPPFHPPTIPANPPIES